MSVNLAAQTVISRNRARLKHKNPPTPAANNHVTPDPEEPPDVPDVPLEAFLEGIECRAIMRALELERWNRTAAAQRLGMTFRSLRCRVKKLGID